MNKLPLRPGTGTHVKEPIIRVPIGTSLMVRVEVSGAGSVETDVTTAVVLVGSSSSSSFTGVADSGVAEGCDSTETIK